MITSKNLSLTDVNNVSYSNQVVQKEHFLITVLSGKFTIKGLSIMPTAAILNSFDLTTIIQNPG